MATLGPFPYLSQSDVRDIAPANNNEASMIYHRSEAGNKGNQTEVGGPLTHPVPSLASTS